jgi:hypothetical protein
VPSVCGQVTRAACRRQLETILKRLPALTPVTVASQQGAEIDERASKLEACRGPLEQRHRLAGELFVIGQPRLDSQRRSQTRRRTEPARDVDRGACRLKRRLSVFERPMGLGGVEELTEPSDARGATAEPPGALREIGESPLVLPSCDSQAGASLKKRGQRPVRRHVLAEPRR